MKRLRKKSIYLTVGLCLFLFVIILKISANTNDVTIIENEDATYTLIDNGVHGGKRDVLININDTAPGRRLSKVEYCLDTDNCGDNENWHNVKDYDESNDASSFSNSVGTTDMTLFLKVPGDKLSVRVIFVDTEPMNISYAKYNLSTDDEREYRDIYVDQIYNFDNYDAEFTNITTGFRGGDLVLPENCTNNGCALKITYSNADYDEIVARLNAFNNSMDNPNERTVFLELGAMNNHLSDYNLSADTINFVPNNDNGLLIEEDNVNHTKSFYLIISKFFYEKNRADIAIGDNKFRILSEDYIGLKYSVDRKYFDEGNNYGFLTFNEFNDYNQEATIFYGTPEIKFDVDELRAPALADGGNSNGMGTIKHTYNKIESRNQGKFPINNNFELSINSFYEQDYVVPIVLKNGNENVQNINLTLSRFAFGGNAGGLLLVDNNGINCRRLEQNPHCNEGNIYVSTSYRGLYDTFYSTGNSRQVDIFEISNQEQGITGDVKNNLTVYERNEDFNPWAVAIFYHDDEVIDTKSFNLGDAVTLEGVSDEVITNDMINGIAKDFGGTTITNYDSSVYTNGDNLFGYGLGYEIPINKIKYFYERSYTDGNIDYTLILASKEEILNNNINRIALFLTNGELKADEANFPELTYGVGEGKIFEIDGRVFEELGGGN